MSYFEEGLSDYMAENYYEYINEDDIYEFIDTMNKKDMKELYLYLERKLS